MSNLRLPDVRDYESARAFLAGHYEVKLAHNTTIRHYHANHQEVIAIRYHETDIVTYYPDGRIALHSNGWVTATTANRMHALTPRHIYVSRKLGSFVIRKLRDDGMHTILPASIGETLRQPFVLHPDVKPDYYEV